MKRILITLAVMLTVLPHSVNAVEQQPAAESVGKALRVRWTQSRDGPQVHIDAVDRAKINKDLFVDLVGMRLWMDNTASAKHVNALFASPADALRVKQQLGDKIMETGIEPEMIPVRGDEGSELGTEGMVLLAGGEFTRTGEFYDSSGGGLTILNDGTAQISQGAKYRVRVSSFYIDKYKVTNENYCRFLNDGNAGYVTPWNPRIGKAVEGKNAGKFVPADNSLAKHPVVLVNWYQAKGYASWAGKRLPTEAEWEYAAGGKEGRSYPWGNEPPNETRLDFPIQYKHPVPVDWFPAGATPEGVFQMAGNSAEWCADYFDHVSYTKSPPSGVMIDPTGAEQAFQPDTWYKYRVTFKGWCKANRSEYFTSTKRHSRPPLADASAGVSFRCVTTK